MKHKVEALSNISKEIIKNNNNVVKSLKHLCLKVKLLREFSVIFFGNSLLVLLAWKVYGERIRNKFMSGKKVRKAFSI